MSILSATIIILLGWGAAAFALYLMSEDEGYFEEKEDKDN